MYLVNVIQDRYIFSPQGHTFRLVSHFLVLVDLMSVTVTSTVCSRVTCNRGLKKLGKTK